jgi:uncharacterized protein YrrD
MKKSKEIYDLPVISISDVNQIGKVKGLIINPENFSVDFLTVEQDDWQVSVKAIPYPKIVGIGESAVMVEKTNSVIDLNELPFINQLLNKQIHLIGSKVLTRKGDLSGEISDYFFNDDNGQLESLLILSGSNELFLPIENVISFGKDRVIINDSLLSSNIQHSKQTNAELRVNPLKVGGEAKTQAEKKAEIKAKLIELLKVNPVSKDIYSKSGNLLFKKGTILTDTDISSLKKEGAKVFVEISMDLKE